MPDWSVAPSSLTRAAPASRQRAIGELIKSRRRERRWSARRIHCYLLGLGHQLCLRTVGRWPALLGIPRLHDLSPDGDDLRRPRDGSGDLTRAHGPSVWEEGPARPRRQGMADPRPRVHRRQNAQVPPWDEARLPHLHSAVDGYSWRAYTESLAGETVVTTIGFFRRARAF
jgi:hypothetical protein